MKSKVWILSFGLIFSHTSFANEEMLSNGAFTKGLDNWWSTGAKVSAKNQEACVSISNPGKNPWDVILGQGGLGLDKGKMYSISFNAYASEKTQFRTLIQHQGAPYTAHFSTDISVGKEKQQFNYQFIQQNDSDSKTEFQFQMGAQKTATVCVSDVSVKGEKYVEIDKVSPIRTNQLGFLPKAEKKIFFVSESQEPLSWSLYNEKNEVIKEGKSNFFGQNKASGEMIHQIDISNVTNESQGLVVAVEGIKTFPFDISSNIYSQLKYDALSYFYQNRSGIEIEKRFVSRDDLARPAGHNKDIVTCFDHKDSWANEWPGCDFSLDVTGGWYDAGDHGKYVVNGGIATWTLLNLYERGKWLKNGNEPFKDGSVKIPESGNGVNDLLDEARWNIEFMLSMQIPDGKKVYAPLGDQSASQTLKLSEIDGSHLVFHKVTDGNWTGIPIPPHKDTQKRYVSQPSTAATLNLAAVAAQCARIWSGIDKEFSIRCLTASENAWRAANKYNNIFAYNNFTGGGPYDDLNVQDEFYWAAAELYITTGNKKYFDYIKNSPLFLDVPKGNVDATNDINWQYTAPLGTISLAVVSNNSLAKKNIIDTANKYLMQANNEGYHIPYSVKGYPWGSNSNLVNRGIFLIYANDFTHDNKYIKAAASAMDYLLGANPLNISYITGYGEHAVQNPHHRFWAYSADANSPKPASGALSGGPNSTAMYDPIASVLKPSCIDQTCYSDDIGAWALNEITINWNAPLVWVATALDESELR
jgi:endoglucanase